MRLRTTFQGVLFLLLVLLGAGDRLAAEPAPERAKGAGHWAFQPVGDVRPPTLPPGVSVPSPIDQFIRARLAVEGRSPALPAERRTLLRRVYFDLLGLPPSPTDVEGFVGDGAPDAFSRLVDRLLASPRYGERWGRWWLDLARYADSNGQDENKVMANAWRYRDWVIRAFNANQPFDQFAIEQLAGDLLPTNGLPEDVLFDRWTATGLLVLGPKMLAEQDKPKLVMDLVDEQIDVVTRAFLGLTVGCARCHDHKFDPISARDYYALAGIFKSTRAMENLEFVSKFNERRIATREQLAAIAASEQALAANQRELSAAVDQAKAGLLETWKRDFPAFLAAARRTAETGGTNGPADPPPQVRLAELLRLNPATNTVSRTLHELAAAPDRLAGFLQETGADSAAGPGLRLGPGRVGAGFVATGSNHLELAHTAALDPAELTVETWVRTDAFPQEGETRRWLVNKNANEWTQGHYALLLDRGRAGAYLNIGGGREDVFAVWTPSASLPTNQWFHLAFTYDGAALRLYVDGRPAGETLVGRPRVPGTNSLALGRRQDGYVNFRGWLDEVRVFDRALPAAEIAAHVVQPEAPVGNGVVARWEFNDLSEADRAAVARSEVRDAVFGAGGVLALPADPRPLYPAEVRANLTRLEQQRAALQASAPPPAAFALAVTEDAPADLPVFVRGSHLNPGPEKVPRGFIRVVTRGEPSPPPPTQSGRLELARWLTSPENPLTARVIVNRVWQAHFGEGLVRTSDNFGVRGEVPSHPELLDWLAREFIRSGWDMKHLHRLILNSDTWQQAASPAQSEYEPSSPDPENRLLAYFPRQRLEAEMVRDALLAVSGRLDLAAGGSLVLWKNNEYVPADDPSANAARRSVYLPIVRDRVYDVFTIFDFANPSVGTARRIPTVVAHQALFFLNSPLVQEAACGFADGLLTAPEADDAGRVTLAYQRAFSRPPTEVETARALHFLAATDPGTGAASRRVAWTALCQTLFAANEFLYRE